jgi:hypothetical protein
MRCQHVDDDVQCRFDATRRVFVGCGDPPDPARSGFAGTIYTVQVCDPARPRPPAVDAAAAPPGYVPIGERPSAAVEARML